MIWLLIIGAGLFAVLAAFAVISGSGGQREITWEDDVAEKLGLQYSEGGPVQEGEMTGEANGVPLVIEVDIRGGIRFTRVSAGRGSRIPEDVVMGVRGSVSAHVGPLPKDLIVTIGDPTFDRDIVVLGKRSVVLALLADKPRGEIRYCLKTHSALVRRGEVVVELPGVCTNVEKLQAAMHNLSRVAAALQLEDSNVAERLKSQVSQDGIANVRKKNLEQLVQEFSGTAEATAALNAAAEDPDADLRLLAAKHLGQDGVGHIQSVLESNQSSSAQRIEALELLVSSVPDSEAGPILLNALTIRDDQVRAFAVRELGAMRYEHALREFKQLLPAASPTVATAIMRAAGQLGGPEAEALLLSVLGVKPPAVQRMAALMLAEIASEGAIVALNDLAESPFTDTIVREAAKHALRSVKERRFQTFKKKLENG